MNAGPYPGSPRPHQRTRFGSLRNSGVRRPENRWIAGVCAGVAERWAIDPLIVRAGFLMLCLVGGLGFLLYLVLWLLMPRYDGDLVIERAINDGEVGAALMLGAAFLLALMVLFGGNDGWLLSIPFVGVLGLMAMPFLIWLVMSNERHVRSHPGPPGPYAAGPSRDSALGGGEATSAPETGTAGPAAESTPGLPLGMAGGWQGMPAGGGAHLAGAPHLGAGGHPGSGAHLGAGGGYQGSFGGSFTGGGYAGSYNGTYDGAFPAGGMPPGPVPPAAFGKAYGGSRHPLLSTNTPVVRTRRRVLDPLLTLALVGLSILIGVGVSLVAEDRSWPGNHHVEGILATVVALSLACVGAGLAGRRAGLLMVTTLVASFFAAPLAPFPQDVTIPPSMDSRLIAPVTISGDTADQVGFGELKVDLTAAEVRRTGEAPPVIRTAVGGGAVYVQVPEDLTVEVRGQVTMGAITSGPQLPENGPTDGRATSTAGGLDVRRTIVVGEGAPDVIIDAAIGMGELRISEPALTTKETTR